MAEGLVNPPFVETLSVNSKRFPGAAPVLESVPPVAVKLSVT